MIKNGKNFLCKFCGKKFYVPKYRLKTAKYCSQNCTLRDNPPNQKTIKRNYGKNHPRWKGGKTIHSAGYILLNIGYKKFFEHRKIMEKFLGRRLERKEHVHHRNGDKTDNRIENLMLFEDAKAHAEWHVKQTGVAHS